MRKPGNEPTSLPARLLAGYRSARKRQIGEVTGLIAEPAAVVDLSDDVPALLTRSVASWSELLPTRRSDTTSVCSRAAACTAYSLINPAISAAVANPSGSVPVYRKPGDAIDQFGNWNRSESQRSLCHLSATRDRSAQCGRGRNRAGQRSSRGPPGLPPSRRCRDAPP
jgi:hypothetical protein